MGKIAPAQIFLDIIGSAIKLKRDKGLVETPWDDKNGSDFLVTDHSNQ